MADSASSSTYRRGGTTNAPNGRPLRLLLVEDSLEDAELIARALKRSGLSVSLEHVDEEGSFLEALATHPDAVIADYHLPRFSGERALALTRARDPDLPFIVVSGTIGEEMAVAVLRRGATDYLLKDRLAGLGEAVVRARQQYLLGKANQAAQERLLESEGRFRRLAENAPDLIFRYRTDPGTFEYVSPAALAITGYTPEEFYADPGLAHRLAREPDREAQESAFRSGTGGRPLTLGWLHRDGGTVWTEQRSVALDQGGRSAIAVEGIVRDVTERKRAEEATAALLEDLRATESQRRGLLARLVTAQEEEARRIAADIHDDSIQIMASAGMRLGLLARKLHDPDEAEAMEALQQVVSQAIGRLRRTLVDLRPVKPGAGGLATLIEDYLAFHREDATTVFDFQSHLEREPPPDIQIILFRIAQEALTNVRKHAQGRAVEIRLDSAGGGVVLRVSDDGVGLPVGISESPLGHVGLTAMRERAETAGGWFRVGSRPGGGTVVECWVPAHGAPDP